MDNHARLYTRHCHLHTSPRPARPEDMFMYQAILGKTVEIEPEQDRPAWYGDWRGVQSFARRAWAGSVSQITRIRGLLWNGTTGTAECETEETQQPPVAGWLRTLSEEAFKRLDQAHTRLRDSRHGPIRRRVESREVMSIRPVEEHDYKRVA
jgi:hypothetical protein